MSMNRKIEQKPDVLEAISLAETKRRKLRFEYNLAAITAGSPHTLGSEEFVSDLTAFIGAGVDEEDRHRKILIALGTAVVSPEKVIRERALALFSVAALRFLRDQDGGKIELLVRNLSRWLEYEPEVLPGLETVIKRVEELSDWLLRMSLWGEAEKIVGLLASIQNGGLEKSKAIKGLAGRCLTNLTTRSTVDRLADVCLQHEDEQEVCLKILRSLGGQSADFLFDRCLHSSDSAERQALLHLAAEAAGDSFWGLVEEALHRQPPAEVLREIIVQVAEGSGGEAIFPALQQCFAHENTQVQQEMIRCVVKLGGPQMKVRLLAALGAANDSLKIGVIRLLAEHGGGDASVLAALCEIIERRGSLTPARQGLVRAVAVALQAFPHRKSIEALGCLQREYDGRPDGERLLQQIDRSLKILRPRLRHDRHFEDAGEVSYDTDPLQMQAARNKAAKIEEEVRKVLRQGNGKGAGRLLCGKAREAGKSGDYLLAEMLMDRVLEVDPLALDEAVELGRWLENQKKIMAEPLSSEAWGSLSELLAPQQVQALQRVMRRQKYRKGDLIIQAGEADESLYFIAAGEVGLNCHAGGHERFLKRIRPGSVLGTAQFFAASVWTFSLRALSDVRAYVLGRVAFCAVAGRFPELERKLYEYCAGNETRIADLVKSTGEERREFPRYPATRLITSSLRNPYGSGESREFHGELVDVSQNGLAFTIRISSRENARLLVGREIASVIHAGERPVARCSGIVVGVRELNADAKDFSVHVMLAGPLDKLALQRITSETEQP